MQIDTSAGFNADISTLRLSRAQILWLIAASVTLATQILNSLRNVDTSTLQWRAPAVRRGRGIPRWAHLGGTGRHWGALGGNRLRALPPVKRAHRASMPHEPFGW